MRIFDLKTTVADGQARLSVSVDSESLGPKELWFSTPVRYEHCLSKDRMDGFLVGMLFPAMQYGEDIHIEGAISRKLLFNLNNYAVPLLMAYSASNKQIRITATRTTVERFDCQGVGTGFSAGVDSFCTIYDRYELDHSDYRINTFLFLNVGSHGGGDSDDDLLKAKNKFKERFKFLGSFPEQVGVDFIPLDSNLHAFHPWGHQKTCVLTMASGILLMQNWFTRYYCASLGWSYLELLKYHEIDLDRDLAIFDPALLPLLSTESIDLIPDGIQYTRTEKTLRIVDYEPTQRYLNVCVSGEDTHRNCSVCTKCCRTLMTLKSAGKLRVFSKIFDIQRFETQAERKFICKQMIARNRDPFARGNVNLAKKNGVKLPSLPICHIICGASNVYSSLKRTGNRFATAVLSPNQRTQLKNRLQGANSKK